jgi:methyl-accepting chemotaxis protein
MAPVIEKGEAMATTALPLLEKVKPLVEQTAAVFEKAGPVIEKAGPAVDKVNAILTSTQQIIEENRPRVAQMTTDVGAIVKSGREQAQNLGNLLQDASVRARTRIEQIDRSVDSTVEQVEQMGENVRRAAMRPVREVNGIAAAISATVSTLVHGSRRSSVDHATQDEEMFI